MTRRRRAYRPTRQEPPFKLENPEVFPAWVYGRSLGDADTLRGGPVFDALAEMGFRVQVLEQNAGLQQLAVYRPWTYIFVPVPSVDWAPAMDSFTDAYCSVIMDCHFPIMNMENAIGPDQVLIDVIDRKDILLANLALAEVVTVPHPDWAADLAELNPNTFLLPDLDAQDEGGGKFMSRLATAAQLSGQVKSDRTRLRGEMGL